MSIIVCAVVCASVLVIGAAAATVHTVVRGDTMWRIATRYEVGISEIRSANPQIVNPDLIYPGQTLTIPSTNGMEKEYETEVIRLVNLEREAAGLSPLKYNWELSRVAAYKSRDMRERGYFSHTSPTYGSPFEMIRNFGISYRSAGENIARGYKTPASVVEGWMSSSGHRANILNPVFTEIGVGYDAQGHYWTQMFIKR
ncbi:MAG: SafA/ExsA family spore coat assembly protein [Clostridia bacterium]|nr:SafA/ExsA family spore coat assembly protein [Clostridia bacterium]